MASTAYEKAFDSVDTAHSTGSTERAGNRGDLHRALGGHLHKFPIRKGERQKNTISL